MSLKQLNWLQIDTENVPSGSQVVLGSEQRPIESAHINVLSLASGLTVNGSTTIVGSVDVGEKITTESGSLFWDGVRNKWVGGVSGEEHVFIGEPEFNSYTASIEAIIGTPTIWKQTGSFHSTTNDLQLTGSMVIRGDLRVEGSTTLVQTTDPNVESLIVSGAMNIVKNHINTDTILAMLKIEGLGEISDRNNDSILDLGGFL